MTRQLGNIFLALPILLFFCGNAHAVAGSWQGDDALSLRLISGVDGVGDKVEIPLGLEVKLSPDWHTYWRAPGEAGLPPQFNWQESQNENGNLKSAVIFYPAPKRYTAYGLQTIGYRDYVVFPITAELTTPGKALNIDTALDILVCSHQCMPKHFRLTLSVPAAPATESAEASIIEQARNKIPKDAQTSGLSISDVQISADNLIVTVAAQQPLEAPDIFVEDNKYIDFTAPVIDMAPDKMSVRFTIKPTMPLTPDMTLAALTYTFTVTDGDRALEQKWPQNAVTPAPAPVETKQPLQETHPSEHPLPLGLAILLAIIGGFILNLMPCVLPVLSLKILSVVSHGGGEPGVVRHSFLMTAAGILFSFLVLAAATVGLKEAGLAIGWGVQFQQPVFLGFLVLLLTFFAANMWGLFEIRLPQWLADNLTGPYHPKLAGDFATGAFATLLATPCSAPFLGTAIGFALAAGAQEIFIIFTALGFGMTLPYLAVAFVPRFATALPKPGIWMMHLRHFMAWALAITAFWFVWVLAAQISPPRAIVFALCMVAIVMLFGLNMIKPRRYLILGVAGFAILAFGMAVEGSLAPKPVAVVESGWVKFNESQIANDVAQGKIVFVDVTADWCITCKANAKLVLSRDDIKQLLSASNVVAMQANWTNPDPVISTFLKKHKRFGIPFNIIYGPGAPDGIVLPELLTPEIVKDAFVRAGKTV